MSWITLAEAREFFRALELSPGRTVLGARLVTGTASFARMAVCSTPIRSS